MRKLHFSVFRHNPHDPDSTPHMQEYEIDEAPRMTLFQALTQIREELDPSLQFDFVCRSAICGSCGMLVNGQPKLACHTRVETLPDRITLLPLPFFKLVGDLSVDTGTWFRQMGARVESWVHANEAFDPKAEEARMSNDQAEAIYDLDRCIECGCCLAACGAAQMNKDFLGATGLLRVARFEIDPRDKRTDAEYYEVTGNEDGIFGCIGLLACDDFCPKHLPLQEQLAYIRRTSMRTGVRSLFGRNNGKSNGQKLISI